MIDNIGIEFANKYYYFAIAKNPIAIKFHIWKKEEKQTLCKGYHSILLKEIKSWNGNQDIVCKECYKKLRAEWDRFVRHNRKFT